MMFILNIELTQIFMELSLNRKLQGFLLKTTRIFLHFGVLFEISKLTLKALFHSPYSKDHIIIETERFLRFTFNFQKDNRNWFDSFKDSNRDSSFHLCQRELMNS